MTGRRKLIVVLTGFTMMFVGMLTHTLTGEFVNGIMFLGGAFVGGNALEHYVKTRNGVNGNG